MRCAAHRACFLRMPLAHRLAIAARRGVKRARITASDARYVHHKRMHSELSTRDSHARGASGRRPMRPTISIVLASSQPRSALDAYVSTLTARCAGSRTELIIARADTALHIGLLSRIHPQARFVSAPGECSMGELRTYGMRAATGDIVLLL